MVIEYRPEVMQMPTVSESITNFLHARKTPANADLVDRYSIGMEVQVNVAADKGEPVEDRRNTYTDGEFTWFNIRAPKNAAGEPEFHDYEIRWPLDYHAEGIGMTGWDWQGRKSCWVAFDFDSITSHAKGVGVSDDRLKQIKEAAKKIPYVEVRRSTGGGGLHLYVYLDSIPTENHTVHAALARCILGMMSSEVGFDFGSAIDVCGGIMWVWHRKMSAENHGLEIIKTATKTLGVADLPSNWRDNIAVVTRQRAKLRIAGVTEENADPFEALTSSRPMVPLDEDHKALIEALTHSGYSSVWVPDHHLLQTHTKALQELLENPESKQALKLKGVFRTNSEGRHPETCNCFAYPMSNGAWRVYRFSPGVNEADTWDQDGDNWTNCYFNRAPDLHSAAKVSGGVEARNNGGYVFETAERAVEAIEILGASVEIPEELQGREARLRAEKDGRVSIEIKKAKDEETPKGWVSERGRMHKILNCKAELKAQVNDDSYSDEDKHIRTFLAPESGGSGWVIRKFGRRVERPAEG